MAAVGLGMSALAAEPLHVHHRETEDLNVGQGLFDGFQTMGLDQGDNQFHSADSELVWSGFFSSKSSSDNSFSASKGAYQQVFSFAPIASWI